MPNGVRSGQRSRHLDPGRDYDCAGTNGPLTVTLAPPPWSLRPHPRAPRSCPRRRPRTPPGPDRRNGSGAPRGCLVELDSTPPAPVIWQVAPCFRRQHLPSDGLRIDFRHDDARDQILYRATARWVRPGMSRTVVEGEQPLARGRGYRLSPRSAEDAYPVGMQGRDCAPSSVRRTAS